MNESTRYAAAAFLSLGLWSSACSTEDRDYSGGAGGSGGSGGGIGGGSSNACATALACDDFEAQTIKVDPTGPFSKAVSAGEVFIDDTRAFSGKHSVRLSTGATDGFKAALLNYNDPAKLPTPNNAVYGRMMFWLESAPASEINWNFIIGVGAVPDPVFGSYTAVYRYGGQYPVLEGSTFVGSQLLANYGTPDSFNDPPVGPSTNCWSHSDKKVVPVAKWTCAEFHFDGANSELRFWLDGDEVPGLHVQKYGQGCISQAADYPWIAPTFTDIFVGWESYVLDEPRTIWIDDLAIGTERLGCP